MTDYDKVVVAFKTCLPYPKGQLLFTVKCLAIATGQTVKTVASQLAAAPSDVEEGVEQIAQKINAALFDGPKTDMPTRARAVEALLPELKADYTANIGQLAPDDVAADAEWVHEAAMCERILATINGEGSVRGAIDLYRQGLLVQMDPGILAASMVVLLTVVASGQGLDDVKSLTSIQVEKWEPYAFAALDVLIPALQSVSFTDIAPEDVDTASEVLATALEKTLPELRTAFYKHFPPMVQA